MTSAADLRAGVTRRATDPVLWNDLIQIVKTAAAAVIAWVLATSVLHLPQSFLAPWAALLVVNATVYRTLSTGVRQVSSTVVGVVLAWAVGNLLGLDPAAVAVALVVGLAVGALSWFGEDSTAVAATALIVLTTGFSDDDSILVYRLLDTAIGIAVGLVVNLVVWPPLRRRTAISAMDGVDDRIGGLLVDVAEGLRTGRSDGQVDEWVDRTRGLDHDLDQAWALVRQARESARMNPRRSAADFRDPQQWYALLRRMEQSVAEARSMVRTLGRSSSDVHAWDPFFRESFVELLADAGRGISQAEPGPVHEIRARLDRLVLDLSRGALDPELWPEYGALVINLRNIVEAMAEVAESNPLGQPPLPFRMHPAARG